MLNTIKKMNRALLELLMGIVFLGILIQIAGGIWVDDLLLFSVSAWIGVVAAVGSAIHMYKSLDRILSMGAGAYGAATKTAMIRYFAWAFLLGIVMVTEVLNPIYTFLGLLTLKVAAYLQPFTHKFCNYIFQETDPIPEAIPLDDGE